MAPRAAAGKTPKKFAGQAPPNQEFYAKTFEKDQISGKQLVRGLHIDNEIARRIDNFIDRSLREESLHLREFEEANAAGEVTEHTREAKFFELDHGKNTQFMFDGIYTALVAEFSCFTSAWQQANGIPWCWHTSAIRIWVRNNRQEMVDNPKLQTELGGFKRRYAEEVTVDPTSPTKRQKSAKKRAVRLVDQALKVVLYQRVTSNEEADVEMEDDTEQPFRI